MHKDGAYPVYVNGSRMKQGDKPFAVLELGPGIDLYFDSPAEGDQLTAAIREAMRLLEAAAVPHPFRHEDAVPYRCADCGIHRGHHLEGLEIIDGQ